MSRLLFPDDFIWGAATSAYQIEGAHSADGKGESIWDRFTARSGTIADGSNGKRACNHYALFEDDVKLMKDMGLESYRFSIAWPRIMPDGMTLKNQKGVDFYKRLTELLLKNGIAPMATLYHWDLPQKLQDTGGWLNRDTASYFEEYSSFVFKQLGDIVPHWITINEPFVISYLGYYYGVHAPGIKDFGQTLQVAHHLNLAHGKALNVYRQMGYTGKIGICHSLGPAYPASDSAADQQAAIWADGYFNRWFLDPVLTGEYPHDMLERFARKGFSFETMPGDMELISQPTDFLGVNYYSRSVVRANEESVLGAEGAPHECERTDMDWEVYPEGLYDLMITLKKRFPKMPVIISENGAVYTDVITADGAIHDSKRISYIERHLEQLHRAVQSGVDVRGYYAWSLMDNFEWAYGLAKRFGLVYVDYQTQKRIIKDSGLWYRGVIAHKGLY